MNPYTEAIDWIYNRQVFGIKPGLERLEQLLTVLNKPHEQLRVVLVGGTNGKGTVARLVAHAAQLDGQRVGLFTSPHLHHFGERFVVNQQPPTQERLKAYIEHIKPHAEEIGATFFEIVTALAFVHFAEEAVDLTVLEVGLGGLYDATNIANPIVSAVVSVSLDHTEILGNTIEAIARDKAGIFRPGMPAVTGATGEALDVLREEAMRIGAELNDLSGFEISASDHSLAGQQVALGSERVFHTPLIGVHQPRNIAVAYGVAQALGVRAEAFVAAARESAHPARLEVIERGPTWLIDGAHNAAAAEALANTLADIHAQPDVLIVGTSQEKNQAEIAQFVATLAPHIIVTRAVHSPRATEIEQLQRVLPRAQRAETPSEALALAEQLAPNGLVLVAGSLFLAAEVRALLLDIGDDGQQRFQ